MPTGRGHDLLERGCLCVGQGRGHPNDHGHVTFKTPLPLATQMTALSTTTTRPFVPRMLPLAHGPATCYANVMSIQRITISVPVELARRIKKSAAGRSVSAWITNVIEAQLDDAELDRLWCAFYESVRPRRNDVRRANAMFKRLTTPSGRERAA
jgi:hypothetical protein